jgi:hypothetical protein
MTSASTMTAAAAAAKKKQQNGSGGGGQLDVNSWAYLFWFNLSGTIGTILFFYFDKTLFASALNPISYQRETVTWTVSYIISILWQHSLHRLLVFGTSAPYVSSLLKVYVAYALSIASSSVINFLLVAYVGASHRQAWVLTLVITGVLNMYTVKTAFEPATAATAVDADADAHADAAKMS